MNKRKRLVLFALAMAVGSGSAHAQQTGQAVGNTPGSAARNMGLIVTRERVPEPTCGPLTRTPAAEQFTGELPDMVFQRGYSLVCMRHTDGKIDKLQKFSDTEELSPDGSKIAYWIPEKGELRIRSNASESDELVEAITGGKLQTVAWSAKGHKLAYAVQGAIPEGIRVIDLDSGKRFVSSVKYTGNATLDPEYLLAARMDGVHRTQLSDGHDEMVATLPNVDRARYSRTGVLLGMLAYNTEESERTPADDDSPDCTGGIFSLAVMNTMSGKILQIPFPAGFNSVLDYEFSPDDHDIAVTFGAASCDYPGDVARVYTISLPTIELTPVSRADRLAVQARWSPNGRAIIYQDYTGSDSPLMVFDLATHKTSRLTSPGQLGPDNFLGWR